MKAAMDTKQLRMVICLADRLVRDKLSNGLLYMEARGDEMRIASTNLEAIFVGSVSAEVAQAGTIVIMGEHMIPIVKSWPDCQLTLTIDRENQLLIQANQRCYAYPIVSPDQYPPIPTAPRQLPLSISASALRSAIRQILYATPANSILEYAGILLEQRGNEQPYLRLVATDGYRLALVDLPIPSASLMLPEDGLIIPRSGMALASYLLQMCDEVQIGISGQDLVLASDRSILYLRPIHHKYPNYRAHLSRRYSCRLKVGRSELLAAVKRLAALSSELYRGIRLTVDPDGLCLSYQHISLGSGQEWIGANLEMARPHMELPMTITLNYRFLLEPLMVMSGEWVCLGLTARTKPLLLTDPDNPNHVNLIMPMDL